MTDNLIPIKNVYHMLLYAWDMPIPKHERSVSQTGETDLYNFLARVFAESVENLIKRGLGREYVCQAEDTGLIRGKIDFSDSIKRQTMTIGCMACTFDEMTYDMPMNRIIKSTARSLLGYRGLDKDTAFRLDTIINFLGQIRDVPLNQEMFKKIRIHRNNSHYALPIHIAEVLYDNSLLDEKTGRCRFKDFYRDENMALLFEKFVFRFYEKRQSAFQVRYQKSLKWDLDCKIDHHAIPEMRLDILLIGVGRNIVIDTKYYREALKSSGYGSERKLISGNLYQLHTYLVQGEKDPEIGSGSEGILLYPKVDQDFCFKFSTKGHQIKACSVNLNQSWYAIEQELLEVIRH